MIGNTMPSKINVRDIPVQNINCGNIIFYLDQLWKVIKIRYSLKNSCINFHAIRQINNTDTTSLENIDKDIIQLQRVPEASITIVEST